MPAFDCFLKIDGILGESRDEKHAGEIDVLGFSWGETEPGAVRQGGGGAGKVEVGDLTVRADTSKASPGLILACAAGRHLPTAVLTCRAASAEPVDFLVFTLADVAVTSYRIAGSTGEGGLLADEIGLSFAELTVDHRSQRADGTLEEPVSAHWNVREGTEH